MWGFPPFAESEAEVGGLYIEIDMSGLCQHNGALVLFVYCQYQIGTDPKIYSDVYTHLIFISPYYLALCYLHCYHQIGTVKKIR